MSTGAGSITANGYNPFLSTGASGTTGATANNPLSNVPQYQNLNINLPAPKTSTQLTAEMVAGEKQLPQDLRVTSDNVFLAPEARARYEQDFYNQQIKPREADLQTQLFQSGLMGNSSFGGALLGQLAAQGGSEKMRAGEQLYANRLSEVLGKRQSLFGGEGKLVVDAENNRLAQEQLLQKLLLEQQQQRNQFDLQNFDNYLTSYSKMQSEQQQRNSQLAQNFNTAGNFLGGAAGGALGAVPWQQVGGAIGRGINNLFGGSNNGSKYPYNDPRVLTGGGGMFDGATHPAYGKSAFSNVNDDMY